MSKIALIADRHIGARSSDINYLRYFRRFYDNVFFPYLDEHPEIDTIIDLGDGLDNRKYVNFNVLREYHEMWLNPIMKRNLTLHSILGNHDVYYRNTNDLNSAKLISDGVDDNIFVYSDPTEIEIDGLKIALLPWVNRQNHDDSLNFIKSTPASVLMGHLELNGYEMVRGIACDSGMNPNLFSRFTRVFSGHFHIKQHKHNIDYLGTPYEITFADAGIKKGFHVFDTKTLDLEFVVNPETMHVYIPYDDSEVDYSEIDVSRYTGKVVKIKVLKKTDVYVFEKFIERLADANPLKYSIIDTTDSLINSDEDVESIDANGDIKNPRNTMDVLIEYIHENFEDETDRKEISNLMKDLYTEAMDQSQ